MTKSFKDISWNVSEDVYRQDPALSYSTLAKFDRTGFNGIPNLFDKISTPSLQFGSIVDCIMTDGDDEFAKKYFVADLPELETKEILICKQIYDNSKTSLKEIPEQTILDAIISNEYHQNWQEKTRVKVFIEHTAEYYSCMVLANGRDIITKKMYKDAIDCVEALRTSEATKNIFSPVCAFDDDIEKLYQLKFKTTLHDIDYRCMADLLIIDHKNKIVYPIDLKTSSHYEWDFYKSFIDWSYHIQARLYWRIIRNIMNKDDVFKDYLLADYQFVVVNKESKCPLVWQFEDTQKEGELIVGNYKLRDPEVIGNELYNYLANNDKVPNGISINEQNHICEWLKKM